MSTREEAGPPEALPFTMLLPVLLPGGSVGQQADGFDGLARIWADPSTDWTVFFLPDDHPG